MLRKLKTMVVAAAALITFAGTQAASAAVITIGSFSLVGDSSGAFIDVENSTSGDFSSYFGKGAVFTNVSLTFADDSSLTTNVEAARLVDMLPGAGTQFLGFSPSFVVPPGGQLLAALTMSLSFVGGGAPAGLLSIGLLDVSDAGACLDDRAICQTLPILYTTAPGEIPVPEPATLVLLAGGLGAAVARRVRRP